MCGVGGFSSRTTIPLEDMRPLLDELATRGVHSTGVSWHDDYLFDAVETKIEKVPSYEFKLPEVNTKAAIFHTRYSTSNIDYPQPVHNTSHSVVHNGVVTQAPFETWKETYGYEGDYKCDSVLLLPENRKAHPLVDFPESSMAICEVNFMGDLMFYRNEQRPLYYIDHSDFVVVGSTKRS